MKRLMKSHKGFIKGMIFVGLAIVAVESYLIVNTFNWIFNILNYPQ